MNRQIKRIHVSRLVWVFFCAFVVSSLGCDLGTYNKRFKERNQPVKAKPAEKNADDKNADDNEAAESADSQ